MINHIISEFGGLLVGVIGIPSMLFVFVAMLSMLRHKSEVGPTRGEIWAVLVFSIVGFVICLIVLANWFLN